MASGHVNRTNRPNTWLHRPACKREERPCQLGAVHTWHKADIPTCPPFVRFRGQSGRVLASADEDNVGGTRLRPDPFRINALVP